MASAAEVEIGATFLAAQESIPLRTCLEELGHKQPPTPIQVGNTTAVGFVNKTIKQKRSKAIDMIIINLQTILLSWKTLYLTYEDWFKLDFIPI